MLTPLRSAEGPKNSHFGAKFGLAGASPLAAGSATTRCLRIRLKPLHQSVQGTSALLVCNGLSRRIDDILHLRGTTVKWRVTLKNRS